MSVDSNLAFGKACPEPRIFIPRNLEGIHFLGVSNQILLLYHICACKNAQYSSFPRDAGERRLGRNPRMRFPARRGEDLIKHVNELMIGFDPLDHGR